MIFYNILKHSIVSFNILYSTIFHVFSCSFSIPISRLSGTDDEGSRMPSGQAMCRSWQRVGHCGCDEEKW